jgi:hypothetical protein
MSKSGRLKKGPPKIPGYRASHIGLVTAAPPLYVSVDHLRNIRFWSVSRPKRPPHCPW